MKDRTSRAWTQLAASPWMGRLGPPMVLLAISVLAYGLLAPRLGFYWDDLPILWIWKQLGAEGLARYFSTNRPIWGALYAITLPLLGSAPLAWQLSALLFRWSAAVALWMLVRRVWPGHVQAAVWASALFLVYPGFSEQPIAILSTHFFIVLTCFLLSLVCSIRQARGGSWLWLIPGLVLSLLNLFTL